MMRLASLVAGTTAYIGQHPSTVQARTAAADSGSSTPSLSIILRKNANSLLGHQFEESTFATGSAW